jgi:hypothetical protein
LSDSLITRLTKQEAAATWTVKNKEKINNASHVPQLLLPLSSGLRWWESWLLYTLRRVRRCNEYILTRIQMSPMDQNIIKIHERDGLNRFCNPDE